MKFDNLLPIFAPAPAGVVIGIRLYAEIIAAIGGAPSPIWEAIAFLAALSGCVAMIGAEMYSYKQAALALAEHEIKAALLAFILSLVCSGLIVYAVYTSEQSRPLISAVIIAIISYSVKAIQDYRARNNQKQAQVYAQAAAEATREAGNQVKILEAQAALEKERARQAAAEARRAKFENGGQVVRPVREHHEQQNSRLNQDLLARVRAYVAEHPQAGPREVQQALEIPSSSTAKKYLDSVR